MNKREKEALIYYLDQLSLKLKNNISEMQQGLNHLAEIRKHISQEIPYNLKTKPSDLLSADKTVEKSPECLIRISEVCQLISVGKTTLYKMVQEGNFPKPLNLGPRFTAWQKSNVSKWRCKPFRVSRVLTLMEKKAQSWIG